MRGSLDGWEAPQELQAPGSTAAPPPIPINEADGVVAEQEDEELAVEQLVDAASPAQQQAGKGA